MGKRISVAILGSGSRRCVFAQEIQNEKLDTGNHSAKTRECFILHK